MQSSKRTVEEAVLVHLAAAPDGRTLLMDVEMSEKERPGWDGPPPSIWLFDLVAETSRRLTAPSLYAWSSAWLDAPDSILFLSQARNETTPSIYRMSTNGQGADRRLLVRNARMPSTSRSHRISAEPRLTGWW